MLLCPWDFPHKNIGVSYHSLLQGILPPLDEDPDEIWVLSHHTKIQSGWNKWNLNSESFDFQVSIRLYSLLVPTLPGLLLGATVLAFV